MTRGQPRILVVDDDVQIRRALRHALAARGYDVHLAGSGEEAVEQAAVEPPDMVVLDMALPGMSGLDVCRELRTWSEAPILILSVRDRPQDKVAALDLGADDYLTKPFDTSELLARIRSHLRRSGGTRAAEPVYVSGGLQVDVARRRAFRDGVEIQLTRTEFSLLRYLVQNAGKVTTHGLLLAQLWGPEYEGEVQNLRVHVANLRKKIEPDPDRPTLILTEPGVGYRFRDEPPL